MSTLSTANITSKAANTPPVIKDLNGTECGQFCRAWVNFDGSGTVAIRDDFNVSSITDNGTGDYTVNFTTAMANANYAVAISGKQNGGSSAIPIPHYNDSGVMTTTSMRFFFSESNSYGTKRDSAIVCFVAFGG